MSNNRHQNIPCRKHLQYEPPIATCIKLYDTLNCQHRALFTNPVAPTTTVFGQHCWKWLNMSGGNCRPDEFKYARINSGDYSLKHRGSWQHQATQAALWMFHVQKGKYFKRLEGGGAVHTRSSSRNPFGLLRNTIFTNTPWTLALMLTMDDGLPLSAHTRFRPTHTHVLGHNRAWPCTVQKSWRIALSIHTHSISLLSSCELPHVVISLLVCVATLSLFCCIDRSGAITVKTRPAVFLAASGFDVTILALNAYHTAGSLWFAL